VGAGVGGSTAFQLFAAISVVGALVTLLVPRPAHAEVRMTRDEEARDGATVTA
jgi:AAHS family benzoate transporter-like MFS transporter